VNRVNQLIRLKKRVNQLMFD